jgi:hypothetical protein
MVGVGVKVGDGVRVGDGVTVALGVREGVAVAVLVGEGVAVAVLATVVAVAVGSTTMASGERPQAERKETTKVVTTNRKRYFVAILPLP